MPRFSIRCTSGCATTACSCSLPAYVSGEDIFSDYAYFSSYSDSWVAHAKRYADAMIERLGLTDSSLVTEVASNDGYLLQHFLAGGHPGARGRARGQRGRGGPGPGHPDRGPVPRRRHRPGDRRAGTAGPTWSSPTTCSPTCRTSADFAAGLRALVKDDGLVTLEFPHLLRLIERRQYDTIYHEHFSYLSLLTSSRALATAGLRVVDVDELATHGGSLRVYARPEEAAPASRPQRVKAVLAAEEAAGLHTVAGHEGFAAAGAARSRATCWIPARCGREGRSVAGYGAPGKGNTLLNHCGIRSDLLAYTVDRSPVKQGKFLPGHAYPDPRARAPGRDPARLRPGPALEPAGGDQRAARLRPVLGRSARLPDPRAGGRLN